MNSSVFRFNLERVRELREHDESCAKEQLAASLGAQLRGVAMLQSASDLVRDAHEQGRATVAAAAGDLLAHQRWVERVEREKAYASARLAAVETDVQARRDELVEASRRREALERLKQRRRTEHQVATARAEGITLDEIALVQHARRGAAA